jgi:ABC-type bacteriocin/lantibiotic exporter with double-glycine peptidase domain
MMLTNILISFVSAVPIFFIASELALPTITCLLVTLALVFISMLQETRLFWREMTSAEENSGLVFGLISGIERLRVSGSEQRAYARWLKVYAKKAGAKFAVRFPLCVRSELITTVRLLGLLWAFQISWRCHLTVAQLAAFTSAFGIAVSCIDTVANHSRNISRLKPILDVGKPILQSVPESSKQGKAVSRLEGRIELKNVTFRYEKDEPAVLDNLNLTITPGEYVAVVGKSGCGKSTLVKLLLGFEMPDRGTISYDGNDMNQLDLYSLRRNIGTVLQDGKLFSGDIFSNITITAPWLGMDEAWDAAEKAGIAEDIRKMPLGMHTYLGEGGDGISGGQKQRLMIARAIAPKPGILIFDEATSALDNLTQKIVTDSMDAMNCTRIVIAHRLSTIRACDRIIALDQGKIVESGTYDELIARDGFFAGLVKRQQ